MKRDGGIEVLENEDRNAGTDLFDQLAEYGLFVVRGGELESWLKELNASGHGPSWLIEVFEKMGEDPSDDAYVKPSPGDVWAFMGSVKAWLTRSNKKGIPA
jgi:hypothetical protein